MPSPGGAAFASGVIGDPWGYTPPMTTRNASQGILADDNTEAREHIVELLTKAYWMEIETVMSYIANSVNPDGVRAGDHRVAQQGHPGGARPRGAVRRADQGALR